MPLFRPGKPYSLRSLTAPRNYAVGGAPIPWDADETDGEFDAASSSTTVAIGLAGLYLVCFGMGHTAGSTSQSGNARLMLNGVQVAHDQGVSNTADAGVSGSWWGQLDVGDQLQLLALDAALSGGKQLDPTQTYLHVVRVGPVRWT